MDQRFCSIDLGDQVTRKLSKIVGSGNYGLVYEGTLRAEQKRVAAKVIRYGDKSARQLEVSTLFIVLLSVHNDVSESTQRSICLIHAQSRKHYHIAWDYNCFRSFNIHSVSTDVQRERV